MTESRPTVRAIGRGLRTAEQELAALYDKILGLIDAGRTQRQRHEAIRARNRLTAGLVDDAGWMISDIAATIGATAGQVRYWRYQGRDLDRTGLALIAAPGTNPGDSIARRITVGQAVTLLDVSDYTVRRWLREGRLEGRRVSGKSGATWSVLQREVENLIRPDHRYSVGELAAWYCVSERTVRKWVRTGKLEADRVGRRGAYRFLAPIDGSTDVETGPVNAR